MFNYYNPQLSIDKIDKQIADLERLKGQIQQPIQPITQNFQLSPRESMKFVNSIDEVQKETVYITTPYFSKDMAVLWVKNPSGDIKSYELKEIIEKDEKDLRIDFLMAQIDELKKEVKNAKPNDDDANEPTKSKKSSNVADGGTSKTKSE